MEPDNFKQAWQAQSSQTRLTIDADLLLKEVRRNQQHFAAMLFWRDVREVGVALLMVPLWIYLGLTLSLPWAWYLTVPPLLWVAGFMLVHRIRDRSRLLEPGESLRARVESSLAQVEHQIWLLRYVFWWGLLPFSLSSLAFFGQIAWLEQGGGWWTVLVFALLVSMCAIVFGAVYAINQSAVRTELVPRRHELKTLLANLTDEKPPDH